MSILGISYAIQSHLPSENLSSVCSIMGSRQIFLPSGVPILSIKARVELPWRSIQMGGGPRTFPGGVSKWQWKRMQAKKAKQLLKARLCRERQIYEMRKRSELRAAVAELERPWEVVERAPNLFSVKADEQLKVLADRFHRPGGSDLWTEKDGPQLFPTHDGLPSARFFPKGAVHSLKPYGISDNEVAVAAGMDDEFASSRRRSRRRRRRGGPAGVSSVDDESRTDSESEEAIFLDAGATEERKQVGRRAERAFGDRSYQKGSAGNMKNSRSLSDSEVGTDRQINGGRERKGFSGGRLINNGNQWRKGSRGLSKSDSELSVDRRVDGGRERRGLSGAGLANNGNLRRHGSKGLYESDSELGVDRRVNGVRERKGLAGGRLIGNGNLRRNGSKGLYESDPELGVDGRVNGGRERKGPAGGRLISDGNLRRNGSKGLYESDLELVVERRVNGGRERKGPAGGRLISDGNLRRNGSKGLY